MGCRDCLSLMDHVRQGLQDTTTAQVCEGEAVGQPQDQGSDAQEKVGGDWEVKKNHRTYSISR